MTSTQCFTMALLSDLSYVLLSGPNLNARIEKGRKTVLTMSAKLL